ncbi:6361_t:CDS:2 [Funneliformis geosporum]|uniref:DNA-directed DNA polymerase n=1 Tax=Funneliformis geosporum TaxID=1117311 RepID=A0A9W4SQV3_9GLOM|nr:6361_t:CDS:2 [Funneliformis geosporum]CAI2178280.1 589_t:CDS:2 [Funneliformis geosporum]
MVINTRIHENIKKRKYPSAYIFSPKKGIESERPITGLDFASLYPNIIMAYNHFSEKFIFDLKDADIAQNNRNNLHKIEFSFNNHIVQACDKRIPERLNLEYSSVCFDYDYWDSKYKALKVYMNTFYGKVENSLSLIFLHKLAYGTTMTEKYNLNLVLWKCDKAFFREELFKEAYWTEIVKITMDVMRKDMRPKKENLCNNRFMKRIRERNERIPNPDEQFSYIIVKGPYLHDEKGRLIPYRVGDNMEYLSNIAKKQNMEIDINYYLSIMVAM